MSANRLKLITDETELLWVRGLTAQVGFTQWHSWCYVARAEIAQVGTGPTL